MKSIKSTHQNHVCRLCGGKTTFKFTLEILGKHDVQYFQCQQCDSLQTELPYWLDDAYSDEYGCFDTGAVQRNLMNIVITSPIFRNLGVKNEACLDYGGGTGIYGRLMRDQGFNFHLYDTYAQNKYLLGFAGDIHKAYSVVTAYEVFEHLVKPSEIIKTLKTINPDVVIFTTMLYRNENKDWWYLSPDNGQHVFFYTEKALHHICQALGMLFISNGNYHVLYKQNPSHLSYSHVDLQAVANYLQHPQQLINEGIQSLLGILGSNYLHCNLDLGVLKGQKESTCVP